MLDADVEVREIPLPFVLRLAGMPPDVEGTVSGTLVVTAGEHGPSGSGSVSLRNVVLFDERLDRVDGRVRFEQDEVHIDGLVLAGPALTAGGSALWRPGSSTIEIDVEHAELSVGRTFAARRNELESSGTGR